MMITLKNRKSLVGLVVILIFVVAVMFVIWFIWLPQQERAAFENHFLEIMKNVNSTETKAEAISWFEKDYNFTELYEWVNEKRALIFAKVVPRFRESASQAWRASLLSFEFAFLNPCSPLPTAKISLLDHSLISEALSYSLQLPLEA